MSDTTPTTEFPHLPYAGTSGHSGTDTSEAATRERDANGLTAEAQQTAITMARRARYRGVTVVDLRATGLHHGRASGALSVLHQRGLLTRLTDKRDRCKIYVLPEYVGNRAEEPYAPRNARTPLALSPTARQAAREALEAAVASVMDDWGDAEEEQWIDNLLAALESER